MVRGLASHRTPHYRANTLLPTQRHVFRDVCRGVLLLRDLRASNRIRLGGAYQELNDDGLRWQVALERLWLSAIFVVMAAF